MRLFTHTMEYPPGKFPLIERGDTQESVFPWRKGRSLVVRLPFTRKARAFGLWQATGTEDDYHARITRMTEIPTQEIRGW